MPPRPDCNYRLDSYQFNRRELTFLFAAVVGLWFCIGPGRI